MSRIGKLPVAIPAGVTVSVDAENTVVVKGPKGTITRKMAPDMNIAVEDNQVVVTRPSDLKKHKACLLYTSQMVMMTMLYFLQEIFQM